jgi:N-acetylmuramoyl-L-alanine amidase
MKILIDNGHGSGTPGKRSPDGRLQEWAYTRRIADRVVTALQRNGIDAVRLVEENRDVSLKERCLRANRIYERENGQAILISIHCNAARNGAMWMNATGWSVYVSGNASDASKQLAGCLAQRAERLQGSIRTPKWQQPYWEKNLAICRDTRCPAVLTENLFMDNGDDVSFLLSETGKRVITLIHYEGIMNYLHCLSK